MMNKNEAIRQARSEISRVFATAGSVKRGRIYGVTVTVAPGRVTQSDVGTYAEAVAALMMDAP
jgi:hypothetical protein